MLLGAFNQEKAQVGAFSVIVQLRLLIVCSTALRMNELLSTSAPQAELHCRGRQQSAARHARIITEQQQPGDGWSLQEWDHDIATSPPAAAMECDTSTIGGGQHQHRALNNDLNLNWTVQQ